MELNEAQYQQIEHCLPKQRGNVSHTNLLVLNAILYPGNTLVTPLGDSLYESGGQLGHVCFPTTCIVSLLYGMFDSTVR
jgi:hypothetical protein